MSKITVLITTKNEEINIVDCINGVEWADEIIVADSFSTDSTLKLAGMYPGVRIIQREYGYPASQKNWAMTYASHEWILILDADERITPELASEIRGIVSEPDPGNDTAAYRIKRYSYFLDKRIRFSGWQNDSVIRLFRKNRARYNDRRLHEKLDVDGSVGLMKNSMAHYTVRTLKDYFRTMDRYTDYAAKDRLKQGRSVNIFIIAARTAVVFFRNYIIKLGIFDGFHGFILCGLSALSEYMKLCKLWELRKQSGKQSVETTS